jgi:hypothetical protein
MTKLIESVVKVANKLGLINYEYKGELHEESGMVIIKNKKLQVLFKKKPLFSVNIDKI